MTKNMFLKGSLILSLSLAASCMLTSCGDKNELSESRAKKALEELTELKDSSLVASISLGYFEESDENTRLTYRKLAKAGMINYKMNVIVDQERRSGWYSSYTEDVPHYFITVSLTDEGKKYIVYNPVQEEDIDLKEKEDDTVYPEVGDYRSDKWKPAGMQTEETTDETDYEDETSKSVTNRNPSVQTPYQQALNKTSRQNFNLLAGFIKIKKVRDIRCNIVEGEAYAEVIYEFDKITPFGRICSHIKKGEKHTLRTSFIHYADKGWKAKISKN